MRRNPKCSQCVPPHRRDAPLGELWLCQTCLMVWVHFVGYKDGLSATYWANTWIPIGHATSEKDFYRWLKTKYELMPIVGNNLEKIKVVDLVNP